MKEASLSLSPVFSGPPKTEVFFLFMDFFRPNTYHFVSTKKTKTEEEEEGERRC